MHDAIDTTELRVDQVVEHITCRERADQRTRDATNPFHV